MSGPLAASPLYQVSASRARLIRPTVADVNLDALLHNLAQARRLSPRARLLAVVKADAYGHGAVAVARALEAAGVDFFGVSLVEEGVELRQAGIDQDILVLGGATSDDTEIVAFHLIPIVFTLERLRSLHAAAMRAGCLARMHLKLETGMGRLGLMPEELPAFLEELRASPGVVLEGLMSHLAKADLGDHAFTRSQLQRFREVAARLQAAGHAVPWRHIANSAAVLDLEEAKDGRDFNLVRPGLMLYGESPAARLSERCPLEPVLTWRTSITHLKRVGPGAPISYGGTWVTPRESLIATLPVGYADGYSRRLSNQGEVLVRGRRAPVVGTICMDMCMIDVTSIPGVEVRDEVVLLGGQGDDRVSAQELARRCDTIPYEILCGISARVPRVVGPMERHVE